MDGANKHCQSVMVPKLSEKYYSDKIFGAVDDQVHKAQHLFHCTGDSHATEARYVEDHDGGEEVGEVISGQELFQKAEIFVGNFYKQLNIQIEE